MLPHGGWGQSWFHRAGTLLELSLVPRLWPVNAILSRLSASLAAGSENAEKSDTVLDSGQDARCALRSRQESSIPVVMNPTSVRSELGRTRSRRSRALRLAWSAALSCALLSGLPYTAADAQQIHACRDADGSMQFQDRPCERRAAAAAAPVAAETLRTPAGMHPSWFERPAAGGAAAQCEETGCTCSGISRPFRRGIEQAVADALYLDGAWHRLESDIAPSGSPDADLVALCDVLMSQRTLRLYAERALKTMRSRARDAENRGFHRPGACEAGEALACEALDDFLLYRRIVADSATLRQPRSIAGSPPDVPLLDAEVRLSR